MADKKRKAAIIAAAILGCAALLYLGGMLGQLLGNYMDWMAADGFAGQVEMEPVDWNPLACIPQAFTVNGLKGMAAILMAGGAVVLYVRLHDKFDGKSYDPRGFKTSSSGAYGTASWMEEKEIKTVLEVTAPAKAEGVILGEYKGNAVCMPKDTRFELV